MCVDIDGFDEDLVSSLKSFESFSGFNRVEEAILVKLLPTLK